MTQRPLAVEGGNWPFGRAAEGPEGRWTTEYAQQWHRKQGWRAGANFIPSTAVNQLEMWQAETFDEETIDRELGYAARAGMRVMRVFLHDLAYSADPAGFLGRLDRYLAVANTHGISTMFVLFDACWFPNAKLGAQPSPLRNIHNSRWLQAPNLATLRDSSKWAELHKYVAGVIGRFGKDARVHSWDIYNENGNSMLPMLSTHPELKQDTFYDWVAHPDDYSLQLALLKNAFAWARLQRPLQPLTACEWNWQPYFDDLHSFLRDAVDVATFHGYFGPGEMQERIESMQEAYPGRPIVLTEYMARSQGSSFQQILPVTRAASVSAINWGLVSGKTNTIWAWCSWSNCFSKTKEPSMWFHDVFRPDGTAYDEQEIAALRHAADGVGWRFTVK